MLQPARQLAMLQPVWQPVVLQPVKRRVLVVVVQRAQQPATLQPVRQLRLPMWRALLQWMIHLFFAPPSPPQPCPPRPAPLLLQANPHWPTCWRPVADSNRA